MEREGKRQKMEDNGKEKYSSIELRKVEEIRIE